MADCCAENSVPCRKEHGRISNESLLYSKRIFDARKIPTQLNDFIAPKVNTYSETTAAEKTVVCLFYVSMPFSCNMNKKMRKKEMRKRLRNNTCERKIQRKLRSNMYKMHKKYKRKLAKCYIDNKSI